MITIKGLTTKINCSSQEIILKSFYSEFTWDHERYLNYKEPRRSPSPGFETSNQARFHLLFYFPFSPAIYCRYLELTYQPVFLRFDLTATNPVKPPVFHHLRKSTKADHASPIILPPREFGHWGPPHHQNPQVPVSVHPRERRGDRGALKPPKPFRLQMTTTPVMDKRCCQIAGAVQTRRPLAEGAVPRWCQAAARGRHHHPSSGFCRPGTGRRLEDIKREPNVPTNGDISKSFRGKNPERQ